MKICLDKERGFCQWGYWHWLGAICAYVSILEVEIAYVENKMYIIQTYLLECGTFLSLILSLKCNKFYIYRNCLH